MMKIQNISIIGLGALGVLFGNFFADKLGHDRVSFIADKDRIRRYEEQGVICNGQKCNFKFSDKDNTNQTADLLIFAVKASSLSSAISSAKNYVGNHTIILSLLNGITSEDIIGKALGTNHMLYCVAQGMDAVKLGNQLTYSHMGELCIGIPEDESEKQPMLHAVIDLFDHIDLPYVCEKDIIHRLWSKWMLNVGVNQVVMVTQGNYGTVQREGKARETMKAAMREVIALAKKEHVSVTEEDLEYYVDMTDTLNPDGMPSMRQDGVSGKYSEVELFSGTVINKAKIYNLDVPVNRMLYQEVKRLERNY